MPAKPRKPGKYDENGLPRDPRDWTEDDWASLHKAIETAIDEIRRNHAERS